MSQARWVPLAEVARPHGVRGEVRLRVYNSDSELLPLQREVLLRSSTGGERTMRVDSMRGPTPGTSSPSFAESTAATRPISCGRFDVCVPREAFPPVEDGEFYVCDVIGARVVGRRRASGKSPPWSATRPPMCSWSKPAAEVGNAELPLLDDFVEGSTPSTTRFA